MAMDWGVTSGYSGLFGNRDLNKRSQQQLATMALLDQQYRQDDLDEEAAQIRAQEYDKKISEFSDKLLGPDRDRINAKAKILRQGVREKLKNYGGDMTKFLANGGHSIMNEYVNNVNQSPEASQYLDNKKNMDQVLGAYGKGFGHLLNKNDLQNFQHYGETGEGTITYTGLLNEVEMPDPDLYEYGAEIPAKDILLKNYARIRGNWMTEHPGQGEPDDYTLEVYTSQNYMGKGKEWQRAQNAEREKNRHIEQMAGLQADIIKEKIKAAAKSGKKTSTYRDENGNEIEVDNETGTVVKSPDAKTAKGTGGYTNKEAGAYQNAFSYIKPMTLDQMTTAQLPQELAQMSEEIDPGFLSASFQNLPEEGYLWDDNVSPAKKGTGIWSDIKHSFYDQFAPKGARRLYKDKQADLVKGLYKDAKIDLANKKWMGYQPNDKTFMTNGRRISDNPDVVKKEVLKGDYDIVDVVSVYMGKSTDNGEPTMVMDVMDGKKVDEKKSKEKQAAIFGKGTIAPQMAIVLRDKDGQQFYEVIDPLSTSTVTKINEGLGAVGDLAPAVEDTWNRENRQNNNRAVDKGRAKELDEYWGQINGDTRIFRNAVNETIGLSATGQYDGKRNNLYKSYYVGLAQSMGGNSPDDILQITSNPQMSFNKDVADYDKAGFLFNKNGKKQNLSQMIKDYSNTDEDVVNAVMRFSAENFPEDAPVMAAWYDNLLYLKQRTK